MKRFSQTLSAITLAALSSVASAGITFGPVRGNPGESIRLVTRSETPGGTIQKTTAGKASSGTILISRDRELTWTFRDPGSDGTRRGMVRVSKINTTTKTVIDRKTETSNDVSPLTGKMFAMSKPPLRDWKFDLDGSVPQARIRNEIDELKIYLKRDWYPKKEVNLGDSWEFDPAWVRMLIERDLSKAQTIGTMRLRQVRNSQNRRLAVIDVSIRSTGADFKSDGSESEASVNLSGQVTVNLETMLDESLELKGTVVSTVIKPGETSKLSLPVRLSVTKSWVRDPMQAW